MLYHLAELTGHIEMVYMGLVWYCEHPSLSMALRWVF